MIQRVLKQAKETLKDLNKNKWHYLYTGILIQLIFGVAGSSILRASAKIKNIPLSEALEN